MNYFLERGFQKLEHYRQTDRHTDRQTQRQADSAQTDAQTSTEMRPKVV